MQKTRNVKVIILWLVLVTYTMILLDNSLVFTGSLKIASELNLTQEALSWVSNIYSITFGGFLLVGSKAGDIWGRKNIFLIGLVLFAVGSFLVGASFNQWTIVAARAFQGLGSAMLAPTTMALLLDTFKGKEQTKAIAYYGATAGIGTALGIIVGGFFASIFSWRIGFYINVPISLVLFLVGKKYLVNNLTVKQSVDFIGALLSVFMMVTLVYGIIGTNLKMVSILIAVVSVILFIRREKKISNPMLPLSIFYNRERVGAYLARFFFMGAMLSLSYRIPQLLQGVYGVTPLVAGIGMLPFSVVIFFTALLVPRLTNRFGNHQVMLIGSLICSIGICGLIFFSNQSSYAFGIGLPLIIVGFGQGITLSPLTVSGVVDIKESDSGTASGVVNTVHQMGMAVGLALVVAVSADYSTEIEIFHYGIIMTAVLSILAFLCIFLIIVPTKNLIKNSKS